MADKSFFEERTDQSEIKARIIQKYFYAWANVIMPTAKKIHGKIAYIDLYAGPGRYRDGAKSTPLLILEHTINNKLMSEMLVTLFNDKDHQNTATLEREISNLHNIERLKHKPEISCGEIDQDAAIYFQKTNLVPSFTFVDPFGYRGLSLGIINGVIKDWGCDCVFFFNYNRINAGISNPAVKKHINVLFGEDRANRLRVEIDSKTPQMREALVLEELSQAIRQMGGKYVLPFRFKNAQGTRTSHSLIFVSKHFKGYEIMKEIMAKESSTYDQGVPSFTYSPADSSMPLLFSLAQPLDALEDKLIEKFGGRQIKMIDVYREHCVDTPYIKRNYKEILLRLEKKGRVSVDAGGKPRRNGTLADHLEIRF